MGNYLVIGVNVQLVSFGIVQNSEEILSFKKLILFRAIGSKIFIHLIRFVCSENEQGPGRGTGRGSERGGGVEE